jgi:hypothetical protein
MRRSGPSPKRDEYPGWSSSRRRRGGACGGSTTIWRMAGTRVRPVATSISVGRNSTGSGGDSTRRTCGLWKTIGASGVSTGCGRPGRGRPTRGGSRGTIGRGRRGIHVTARDVVSRKGVLAAYGTATSRNAERFVPHKLPRMGVADPIVHVQPYEPAKQQVAVQLLHQQPLAVNGYPGVTGMTRWRIALTIVLASIAMASPTPAHVQPYFEFVERGRPIQRSSGSPERPLCTV